MRSELARAAAAVLLLATGARAQAEHFPAPAGRATYSRYIVPEQCLAATRRAADSVRWGARRDTLPYDTRDTLPAAAVKTARECGARFSVAEVEPLSLPALRDLALLAGHDSVARAVTERRILAASDEPLAARATVLGEAVTAYTSARPLRLDLAREYLRRLDALGPAAARERAQAHATLINSYVVGMLDTTMLNEEVHALIAMLDDLPDSVRASDPEYWQAQELGIRMAAMQAAALREGPDVALARLRERGWTRGTMLGERAPAITAKYWFARPDSMMPSPRPGKISMVVYVDHACGVQCFPYYATLRRIGRRFPRVEITLVTQTRGYFRLRPPPTPAEEAELDRRYFLDELRLPGALAVDVTEYSRLPEPDGRRIDQPPRNTMRYAPAGDRVSSMSAGFFLPLYLVSADGVIQFADHLWPARERIVVAEIEAMLRAAPESATGR